MVCLYISTTRVFSSNADLSFSTPLLHNDLQLVEHLLTFYFHSSNGRGSTSIFSVFHPLQHTCDTNPGVVPPSPIPEVNYDRTRSSTVQNFSSLGDPSDIYICTLPNIAPRISITIESRGEGQSTENRSTYCILQWSLIRQTTTHMIIGESYCVFRIPKSWVETIGYC